MNAKESGWSGRAVATALGAAITVVACGAAAPKPTAAWIPFDGEISSVSGERYEVLSPEGVQVSVAHDDLRRAGGALEIRAGAAVSVTVPRGITSPQPPPGAAPGPPRERTVDTSARGLETPDCGDALGPRPGCSSCSVCVSGFVFCCATSRAVAKCPWSLRSVPCPH